MLNAAECLLPYPSSHFLEPADTPTGYRLALPAAGMPLQNGVPLSPEPYRDVDGFSPTVQIVMHFPGGVDPARSNAARLLEATRTLDQRSLEVDSPTVLLDADTGERILHFIEPDARAADPARQVLFLRPARSLTPGHHYIVAARRLRHADGSAVTAEAPFAALRDGQPTDAPAIESRRPAFETLFARLADAGVARDDLVLAFDFVVQSDRSLAHSMLAMRDQSFAWLADALARGEQTFTVDQITENDCARPSSFVWRQIQGTYQVPLFLTHDPAAEPDAVGYLTRDAAGEPVASGFTHPTYTIAIPCAALTALVGDCDGDRRVTVPELVTGVGLALGTAAAECPAFDVDASGSVTVDEVLRGVHDSLYGGGRPLAPAVLGHGLFMTGGEIVPLVTAAVGPLTALHGLEPIELIAGATDWSGLSQRDLPFLATVMTQLDSIAALPDRLRQGQLNALVLGRMLKDAAFNRDPRFQTPSGVGVLAGPDADMYYYGISLGGIMGLMHAALSPDVAAAAIDEGSINFSLLLQRSTDASLFDAAFAYSGITDPMQQALTIGLMHELWVRGESAGYATHITRDLLPGTAPKRILMTAAWLDQQVTNHGTEITVRTLGLPNLVPGSLVSDLPQIEDRPGPLESAYVMYDTGSFQLSMPGPFIPPLANLIPASNRCDPHGERRPSIPASLAQVGAFLRPHGAVENFCDGTCDAGTAFEFPLGLAQRCDPFR
ncbi:hypothetical protein KF840_03350 [bacterium]|nr:hypothetical protein [bacterium]